MLELKKEEKVAESDKTILADIGFDKNINYLVYLHFLWIQLLFGW